jgi:hypothetical protein
LLVVNVGFLSFAAYVLGEVAANASERNKSQLELISNLVRDIRDCRQPAKPARLELPLLESVGPSAGLSWSYARWGREIGLLQFVIRHQLAARLISPLEPMRLAQHGRETDDRHYDQPPVDP